MRALACALSCAIFMFSSAPASASPARSKIAILVAEAPAPSAEALAATRDMLARTYDVVDPRELRPVLEGFRRRPRAREAVAEADADAAQRLRRFDQEGAALAIERARTAAAHLAPTPEDRALMVELTLREITLAILRKDEAAQARAAALALSIDPSLELTPSALHPP